MPTRTSRAIKGSITSVIQNILAILFQLFLTPMILIYSGPCVLAAEGCLAGALHWFGHAVADAPAPARDAILLALRQHPRCAIRAFAMRAST